MRLLKTIIILSLVAISRAIVRATL